MFIIASQELRTVLYWQGFLHSGVRDAKHFAELKVIVRWKLCGLNCHYKWPLHFVIYSSVKKKYCLVWLWTKVMLNKYFIHNMKTLHTLRWRRRSLRCFWGNERVRSLLRLDVSACGWDVVEWSRAGLSQRWVLNTDTVWRGRETEGHQRDTERKREWLSELLRGGDERANGEEELFDLWRDDSLTIPTPLHNALMLNLVELLLLSLLPSRLRRELKELRCSLQLI